MRNISSSSSTTTTAQSVPDMVAAIRFHPTEGEKVDFLRKKMKSHNSQACLLLPLIDVHKFEPWELPEHMFPDSPHHGKAWYSFSRCDYKSINSRRFNRETKKGFWKMNSKQRDVGSKYFTCKKRTLTFQIKTFQEGSKSKSVPTGWKMHEYISIKPKSASSPHQERNQQRDLVLCVLKYKPVDSKSNTGTSIRGDFADSNGNRGYIASSPGDDEAATAAAMNQDDGEPGGGSSSSDFINKSLCDMIQEWQSCAPAGECLNSLLPLPEQPQLGHSLDIYSHELVDPGTGGCSDNQAAATNHNIPDTQEILAYKQLEGSAVLGSGNHDDGEPGSGISSDFNDHVVDDMQEFYQLDKLLDLPSSPPELSQPHQLENVPGVHNGKFGNWQTPIGVSTSYVTNKNTIATNYGNEPVINIAFNSYNRATDEMISEVYSQAEENLGLPLQPFDRLQNYTWQSPMLFSEVGELLHANKYIGCNESQFLDTEEHQEMQMVEMLSGILPFSEHDESRQCSNVFSHKRYSKMVLPLSTPLQIFLRRVALYPTSQTTQPQYPPTSISVCPHGDAPRRIRMQSSVTKQGQWSCSWRIVLLSAHNVRSRHGMCNELKGSFNFLEASPLSEKSSSPR